MKTFADMKRRLVPGLVLQAVNHIRPEANGPRTVVKVQGNGYWFNMPGHVHDTQTGDVLDTRAGKLKRYWYGWDGGAKVCRIDGPDTITFLTKANGQPIVTLTFPPEVTS
jgi:hypothetical protein